MIFFSDPRFIFVVIRADNGPHIPILHIHKWFIIVGFRNKSGSINSFEIFKFMKIRF